MRLSPDYRAGQSAGHRWGATASVSELTLVCRLRDCVCDAGKCADPRRRRPSVALLIGLERLLQDDRGAALDVSPFVAAIDRGDLFCCGFVDGAQAVAMVRT